MKEHAPMKGGWVEYSRIVEDELGRKLTAAECKVALDAYINKVSVADLVEKL